MNTFYSSLIINSKSFPHVHQVFRPRYNKEYFKRITSNIDKLEAQVEQRYKNVPRDPRLGRDKLTLLKNESPQLVKLRESLEQLIQKSTKDGENPDRYKTKHEQILEKLESIEDRLMPTVTVIPNRCSKFTPLSDVVLECLESDFLAKQRLTKVLSHRKLSYINNCYSKSVIGPNSHYYVGIGAKLQLALSDYFTDELEAKNFIPVSGLCIAKSALVEAVNAPESRDYFTDPARMLTEEIKPTTLHLIEASRESLVGFVTTLGHISSNEPLKLMTSGASYKTGSDWFDNDDKRVTQTETVHALVLNSSIEQYSMREYLNLKESIWNSYKKLELPTRIVHCSLASMFSNEYDAHRIDVWLPSRREWLQVGRLSHYLDYITVRTGMKRGHLIDSMVYDGQTLVAAIIENRQTSLGKFVIPKAVAEHLTHLTADETKSYTTQNNVSHGIASDLTLCEPGATGVLHNHEQRRYFRHKSYALDHGRRASKIRSKRDINTGRMVFVCIFGFLLVTTDWEEVWISMLPDPMRYLLYDYFYRPARRCWRYFTVPKGMEVEDLSWREVSEMQQERYAKSASDRKRDIAWATRRSD